ncbi:MAG TPA: GDP-L-fucose synthase [Pseudolabrys sp.]|nr:GDP-L-fucose synthase [Pseudolabrys sp.]
MRAMPYSLEGKRIYVAGHRGMVGSALVRRLASERCEIVTVDRAAVDLTRQAEIERWMAEARPDMVFIAAAKVGGIAANAAYPADFLYDNLMIEANLISAAHQTGVEKLIFLGSSCAYPKFAAQPISEDALLSGLLEPTNEPYAVAKIAGIKLAQAYRKQYGDAFISVMPTNLYGPGDNFDAYSSHVLPGLIGKAHEAKVRGARRLVIWGTGTPRREFLHVDDCADAIVHLAKEYSGDKPVNIGAGQDITIIDLARLVCEVIGFAGAIEHDLGKPDGTPRKLMNSAFLYSLGWRPRKELREGIREVYAWFLRNKAQSRPSMQDRTIAAAI